MGTAEDGVAGTAGLVRFIERCREEGRVGEGTPLQFDERALCKPLNADVALSLPPLPMERAAASGAADGVADGGSARDGVADGVGTIVVKFHQRPLYEVVEFEVAHGEVEAVPAGYWESKGA